MQPQFFSSVRTFGAMLLALASSIASIEVCAKQWYVQSGGSQIAFSPQFLTIQAGDRVTFLNLGGYHNVVADDGSFRCAHGCDNDGHGGSGNATASLWFATVAFPSAGTMGYFCEPHGSPGEGMYGTITVVAAPLAPAIEPAPAGNALLQVVLAFAIVAFALLRLRGIATARALSQVLSRRR